MLRQYPGISISNHYFQKIIIKRKTLTFMNIFYVFDLVKRKRLRNINIELNQTRLLCSSILYICTFYKHYIVIHQLPLMMLQESDRTSTLDKSKVNSNLLLSCLSEAGKSSVFSSLDNLNQISASAPRYQRYYKKNQPRKPSMDSTVTLSGMFIS